jgi:hypothetical protein
MRKLFAYLKGLTLAAAVLLVASVLMLQPWRAAAQVPSLVGPYNIDLGKVAGFTNLAGGSGTSFGTAATSPTGSSYSTTPVNYNSKGIVCTLTVSSTSGSPSVAWSIQQYDAASAAWFTLLSQTNSPAATYGPYVLEVSPGIATSSLPTSMSAINLAIPRVWRVSVQAAGAGLAATGYVGCNLTNGG